MLETLSQAANTVGMVGVIIILIAYFFLSTNHWPANSQRFQVSNFIGAWFILFSLYFHWNLASVIIEIAWVIISFIGICKIFFSNKRPK